jgi:hypothetical protein
MLAPILSRQLVRNSCCCRRSFSASSVAAAADVKKLGVVGAGQMVIMHPSKASWDLDFGKLILSSGVRYSTCRGAKGWDSGDNCGHIRGIACQWHKVCRSVFLLYRSTVCPCLLACRETTSKGCRQAAGIPRRCGCMSPTTYHLHLYGRAFRCGLRD